MTSAEHGYRLLELAALAQSDPAARAYLAGEPLDPRGWRDLPESAPFRSAFGRFLEEFGHRAVYEGELANPRWREEPFYLLEQVRLAVSSRSGGPYRDGARQARAAAEAEVARRTFWLRPVIRWLAGRARQGAALREAGKSAMVALGEPLRYLVLEAGRRLAVQGLLAARTDAFHLARQELECFLLGEWDGAGAGILVVDRQPAGRAHAALTPPDIFVTAPDGSGRSAPATPAPPAPGTPVLTGLGVAAGRVSGVARLLRHPAEGHTLREGEILVAPSTDPGWTPLFLRAGAVVTEVGGYLSHGAIVAREYGMPAVSSVPGLLKAVSDGMRITVDGDQGRIHLDQ